MGGTRPIRKLFQAAASLAPVSFCAWVYALGTTKASPPVPGIMYNWFFSPVGQEPQELAIWVNARRGAASFGHGGEGQGSGTISGEPTCFILHDFLKGDEGLLLNPNVS
ncbi:hypothetical protein EFB08_06335 [Rufibacter latericius]|uniref:Uncharacterized protein n=1 Tax=Rufibacter latericius TaxID=2487040 RepID=A0A3M9MU65_9BACT|nr:hypothetical protein EFB08_06335 [Rufibacter latericius]